MRSAAQLPIRPPESEEVMRLAVIAMVALLAACSSGPSPQRQPSPLVDFAPTMSLRTTWEVKVGGADNYLFSPATAADSVFAAAADGTVMRVNTQSGDVVWRINAGMPLTAGVGSDGETVAVAGKDGAVLAFDAQGKQKWKAQVSTEVLSSPAVGEGLVVVRSIDNRITAFDAATGDRRWLLERSTPPLTLRTAPGILVAEGMVYAGLPGGRLIGIAAATGAPLWEVAIGFPRGTNDLERISDVSGMPVLSGRSVCAVAYQGRIGCVDMRSGAARWAREFSSPAGLAADPRFVFTPDDRSVVHGLYRDNGVTIWQNDKLKNRGLSAPASFGRAVAIGDNQGYLHFLAREDGAFLARVATDGSAIATAPKVAGSALIYQTKGGTLAALASD
jgi:outer membrane protein assembly factor BamB